MIIPNRFKRMRNLKETIEDFKTDPKINPKLIKRYEDELKQIKSYNGYFKVNQNVRRLKE